MYIILLVLLLGLVVGSFLNVVIFFYDEKTSRKSLMGRSGCPNCKKTLSWYELFPVLSFVLQKGKCRGCNSKISWQYPLVELLTALMFLAIFNFQFSIFNFQTILNISIFEFLNLIYLWLIFSILIVVTVYDIKHKIIPDSLSFLFAGLAFLGMFLFGGDLGWFDYLAGLILATPFALLWFFSKGEWIGFGDAKLALGIGWFLGLIDGVSSIVLAFWIGSVFGIFLIILSKLQTLSFVKKTFTIKSEIPFAPFLILGMTLIFFFGWDLLSLKMLI